MVKRASYKKTSLKKDYQSKGLKNPFFHSKKNTSSRKFKLRCFLLLVFLVALFWFLFMSPYLAISRVEVKGLVRLDESRVRSLLDSQRQDKRLLFLSQDNIFLFKTKDISQAIEEQFNFASLRVEKNIFSRSIIINIEERQYAFIWQDGDNYDFFDSGGNIIKDESVTEEHRASFLLVENRSGRSLLKNQRLDINDDYLPLIFNLVAVLNDYPDFKIDKFLIDNELNTVKLKLVDGPEIYFSSREVAGLQVEKLALVSKEMIKDSFKGLKYIDLRYQDKVYYQ